MGDTFPLARQWASARAAIDRKVVHVRDLARSTGFAGSKGDAQVTKVRTLLAMPLLANGTAIGSILIRRTVVRPFTARQIALLRTFADQAAIAMENARLSEELEASNRDLADALERQTATSEVLKTISRSISDLEPVLGGLIENAVRLCRADKGFIYREDGDVYRVAASHGHSPEWMRVVESYPIRRDRTSATGRAVLERRAVHIPDIEADPEYRWAAAERGREEMHRTILAVPMMREDAVIGVIVIRRTRVEPFTAKQIELVTTFADQAVIAIENARLLGELQAKNVTLTESLEQQTATAQILQVISSSPTDVQPVFDAIAESALRLLRGWGALVVRFDGRMFHAAAVRGGAPGSAEALRARFPMPALRGEILGEVILDGAIKQIADVDVDDVSPGLRASARVRGWRANLGVPMLHEGKPIGVIAVTRATPGPWAAREVDLLKTFADQAVIAIENVRLFTELQSSNGGLRIALEQQTATSDLLKVIGRSTFDLQPVFTTLAESAVRLCEAHQAFIFRLEGQLLRVVAVHNISPELRAYFEQNPFAPGRGSVAGRAALDRRTVHIEDIRSDPEFTWGAHQQDPIRTVLTIPMLRAGEVLGVIGVNRLEVRAFTDSQVALLETFADQAAIAIENARLLAELRSRNADLTEALEQQTATAEILRVISSSPTDVQPVFDAIAEHAARLCDANDAEIYVVDGDVYRRAAHRGPVPIAGKIGEAYPITRGRPSSRAIVDRRTIHVHDQAAEIDTEYPDLRAWREVGTVRTILATPLLREGAAIGVIGIRRTEVKPFSEKQIGLLQTFADQAVIAIENVRLFRELDDRNRDLRIALEQQTATSEILRTISSSPTDLQPVFDSIAASATRLCGALFSLVFRFDGELITLVAHDTATPAQLAAVRSVYPAPPGRTSVAALAIKERRVIAIANPQTSTEYPHIAERARAIGYGSLVSVPMLRGGAAIGTINVVRVEATPFTDTEIELLKTFADQAVIAIENVRLFTELEARNAALTEALEQQTATGNILRVISSSPTDTQPVFDTIVRSAVQLCGARFGVLHRFDGERLHLAAADVTPEVLEALRRAYPMRPSRTQASGRAILTRAVAEIPDVVDDPEYQQDTAAAGRWRSLLAVPMLRADGTPVGTIVVQRSEPGRFVAGHIDMLKTFADQAVIAIENVRLFSELEARTAQLTRSVDELTALGEVSHALSSTLDLETVLHTIVARANDLAGTDACSVWEYDDGAEAFHLLATDNLDEEVIVVARRTLIRRQEGIQGRMAATRAPVQVADIASEGAYQGPLRDVLLRTGTRAILAVPLLRDDRLVGGLTVNRKTPGEFSPETVDLLKTFATQSALAINNARLFREIEDKSRQLEVASRHKSQFLANMSHELRTPLNAILGYTELIADNIYGEVPERMREVLERVDKSGRHLLGLINDILDLSKIEAGQLALTLGPYSMDGVAQTVATQVGALAAEKQLGFELAIADDLPLGQGDERRLTQVLLNLVGNAIKFTDVGKIVVRVGAEGDAYVVGVTDTGPGIAEGDLEKIFEEFQQADTTRAKAKGGTGLGLAISRRIVEMHGGRLWVESTSGQGSTFSFRVPIHVAQQVAVGSSARSGP